MGPEYDSTVARWILPRPEKFDRNKVLLTTDEQTWDTCPNFHSNEKPINIAITSYKEENGEYTNFVYYQDKHPDVTFLDMLQDICSVAKVKGCQNGTCLEIKKQIEDAPAPACDWIHLRDWALTVISCQLNASRQGESRKKDTKKWEQTIYNLSSEAHFPRNVKKTADVDLFDICELINWLETIISFGRTGSSFGSQKPLRTHMSKQQIVKATQTAHEKGICMNRLWNLAVGGHEREEVDLPILMRMLQAQNRTDSSISETSPRSSEHDTCTAEVCCFSSIDSTRVQQLHKCPGKACSKPLLFDTSQAKGETITWWLNNIDNDEEKPFIVDPKELRPYLAISHVWSDGTGGGVQGEGRVNRCLFKYFRAIAERLGCSAIWWDTISIPSERVARQKAISQMHMNFQGAFHTVVHDQSIAQTPWTDQGSSCLALLLSSWFTRAWTALELRMTRQGKVSVIYRDLHDPSGLILKNLDEDILATHPAYSSRGHWIASSLIKQLRQQQFNNIGDILKVLRTRSTSWPRDLMVVAGLLTGHEPETAKSNFISLLTRDIITDLVVIEESFLHHGHATMTQRGGWSWCPFSLLDVQLQTTKDNFQGVYVDDQGAVTGSWKYRELGKGDADKLQPYSFHVSVDWQIRTALLQWEDCILLQNDRSQQAKALLVIPLGCGISTIHDTNYCVLECQFVGTVYTALDWGESYTITVRLGKLENDPALNAKATATIDEYFEIRGPRMVLPPYNDELADIRKKRKESRKSMTQSVLQRQQQQNQ